MATVAKVIRRGRMRRKRREDRKEKYKINI